MTSLNLKGCMTLLILSALVISLLYLAQITISLETHIWLATSILVVVITFSRIKSSRIHAFTMLLGAFVSLRYLCWRFSESLPWESMIDLPFALMLFVAECYGVLIYVLGMFVTMKTRNRQVIPIDPTAKLPDIDVFIPTYDEAPDVVKPTILAATKLTYPGKVNVYLLDDGGTDDKLTQEDVQQAKLASLRAEKLKSLCEKFGAHYQSRSKNKHAKAGNINEALTKTNGELILILDADHIPTHDFLLNTVGSFQAQPRLGFLQTPHFFVTANPIERNLGIENKVQPENEMFYNKILDGMDYWNSCFFCGSAALIRRKALSDVGGISTQTITEDADTAVNIHSKGWDSAYLNRAMVAGLSPDTFGAYVTQRARWSQGMIQIFLLNNPLIKPGLTLTQRLCYLNSTLYWFFPIFRTIFLLTPLLYLLLDFQIFIGNAKDFFIYVIPHLMISLFLTQQIFGKTRRAFFSELYETALSLYLVIPALAVLLRPKHPSFRVTPKGETTDATSFSKLTPVMVTILSLIVIGEIWGIYRYISFPEEHSQLILVLIFNTLNMVLVILCLGGMLERQQRRTEPRLLLNEKASIQVNHHTYPATLNDISLKGAKLTLSDHDGELTKGDNIKVNYYIEKGKDRHEKPLYKPVSLHMRVMVKNTSSTGTQIGCLLNSNHSSDLQAQYDKTYGQSSRWMNRRRDEENLEKGILSSSMDLLSLTLRHVTRIVFTSFKLRKKQASPNHIAGASE